MNSLEYVETLFTIQALPIPKPKIFVFDRDTFDPETWVMDLAEEMSKTVRQYLGDSFYLRSTEFSAITAETNKSIMQTNDRFEIAEVINHIQSTHNHAEIPPQFFVARAYLKPSEICLTKLGGLLLPKELKVENSKTAPMNITPKYSFDEVVAELESTKYFNQQGITFVAKDARRQFDAKTAPTISDIQTITEYSQLIANALSWSNFQLEFLKGKDDRWYFLDIKEIEEG